MKRVVYYKTAYYGYATLLSDGTLKMGGCWSEGRARGKDAYLVPPSSASARNVISSQIAFRHIKPETHETLYVSPLCKIPRDLLRNTGYKITLDKSKANAVVLRSMGSIPIINAGANAVVIYDDNITVFNISKQDGDDFEVGDENSVTRELMAAFSAKAQDVDVICYEKLDPFVVSYLPKCQEYEELFMYPGTYPNYVPDTKVFIKGSTEMNLETLEIWSRYSDSEEDRELLKKSILNSDWQKYPVTLAVFLDTKKRSACYRPEGQWKWLLDQIDYGLYHDTKSLGSRVVEPQDWNLLQQWLMNSLNVPKEGGFIKDNETANNFRYGYTGKLLQSKVAVKPMYIDHPDTFKKLVENIANS